MKITKIKKYTPQKKEKKFLKSETLKKEGVK
jgi:hypothetical protein